MFLSAINVNLVKFTVARIGFQAGGAYGNAQFGFRANLQEFGSALRLAFLATVAALFIRSVLNPFLGNYLPYVTLFPAVAFCAWYCGVWPSIVCIALSLFGVKYWNIASVEQPNFMVQAIGMLVFLLASGAIVYMGEMRRRENERMRREQRSLEERVQERTAALDGANQNLHALSARLLQLQDEERRRFARELHDSVGQSLAGLTLNLSTIRADIERLAKTANALSESEAMVQEMSKEVRTISYLLHPPMLDEAGLASALRWYVEGFTQRSKIRVEAEFPMISDVSHRSWKRPFLGWCRSASLISIVIPGV